MDAVTLTENTKTRAEHLTMTQLVGQHIELLLHIDHPLTQEVLELLHLLYIVRGTPLEQAVKLELPKLTEIYASATGSYPPGVSWPPARTKPWEPDNLTTHRTASPFRPLPPWPYRTARPSDWDLIRRTARPTGGVDDTLYRTQGADCPGFDDLRLGFGGRKSGGRRYKSFNG